MFFKGLEECLPLFFIYIVKGKRDQEIPCSLKAATYTTGQKSALITTMTFGAFRRKNVIEVNISRGSHNSFRKTNLAGSQYLSLFHHRTVALKQLCNEPLKRGPIVPI